MKNLKKILLIALLGVMLVPSFVSALNLNDARNLANQAGLNTRTQTFGDILQTILLVLLSLAFIIAAIFLVIGGYQFITARGNDDAVAKAKSTVTWAIVGIIVIVLAWVIMTAVYALVNTGNAGM